MTHTFLGQQVKSAVDDLARYAKNYEVAVSVPKGSNAQVSSDATGARSHRVASTSIWGFCKIPQIWVLKRLRF